jgi:hypothetical protein
LRLRQGQLQQAREQASIDPLSGNARLNAIPVEVLALDPVGA